MNVIFARILWLCVAILLIVGMIALCTSCTKPATLEKVQELIVSAFDAGYLHGYIDHAQGNGMQLEKRSSDFAQAIKGKEKEVHDEKGSR